MAIKIPRKERTVRETAGLGQFRQQADVAPAKAIGQLGGAVADIGTLIAQRRQTINTQNFNNDVLNSANRIRRELLPEISRFKAQPVNIDGELGDVNAALDDFNTISTEVFDRVMEGKSEEAKNMVRAKLAPFADKSTTELSDRYNQARFEIYDNNIIQAKELGKQDISADPSINNFAFQLADVENILEDGVDNGFISSEDAEDRRVDYADEYASTRITTIALQDAGAAKQILDSGQMDEFLKPETKKILSTDVNTQRIRQKQQADAEYEVFKTGRRDETIKGIEAGTMTETQLVNQPWYLALKPEDKTSFKKMVRDESPFNRSLPEVKDRVFQTVDLAPESITDNDIWATEGLSTKHKQDAVKRRQTNIDRKNKGITDLKDEELKEALGIISDTETAKKFSSDKIENSVLGAKARETVRQFQADNPGENLIEFSQKLVLPEQKGSIERVFDFTIRSATGARFGEPAVVTDKESRRLAIEALTEAGQALTEANIAEADRQLREQE